MNSTSSWSVPAATFLSFSESDLIASRLTTKTVPGAINVVRIVGVASQLFFFFLLVQVRAISPYLGPPSDLSVVKMIPNERLPPRNLHCVRAEKMQAMLKWQPPYDSPNAPLVGR